MQRREFIASAIALPALGGCAARPVEGEEMFGLIGKCTATPGQRDALIAILLEGVQAMPGCLSYVVARDPTDENGVWITEVWDSKESHAASLKLPSVRDAITRGKPLIAGFGPSHTTTPVGGVGLPTR
jgi:quinol monooxygenase YgiN